MIKRNIEKYVLNFHEDTDGIFLTNEYGEAVEIEKLKLIVHGINKFIKGNSPTQMSAIYESAKREFDLNRLCNELKAEYIATPKKKDGYLIFCKRDVSDIYWITNVQNLDMWRDAIPNDWKDRVSLVKNLYCEEAESRRRFFKKEYFKWKNINTAWYKLKQEELDLVGLEDEQKEFEVFLSKIISERNKYPNCTNCGENLAVSNYRYYHEVIEGDFCSTDCFRTHLTSTTI